MSLTKNDIVGIIQDWSELVAPGKNMNLFVGGSSALILCAAFGFTGKRVTIRRTAYDFDYYSDRPYEHIAMARLIEAARNIREGCINDDWYALECLSENASLFHFPAALNNQEKSGLHVYVLKEEVQLCLKISDALGQIDCLREGPDSADEVNRRVADVARLCKILGITSSGQLQHIYRNNAYAVSNNPNFNDPLTIWPRVEKMRERQLHRPPQCRLSHMTASASSVAALTHTWR